MSERYGEVDVLERFMVGPHRVEFERPNIMHVYYSGDVTLEQFKRFDEFILGLSRPVYVLRNALHGGVATHEARAFMVTSKHVSFLIAIVTYGASFHSQTVASMSRTALRALKLTAADMVFVDTEAEARAWIAEHRKQIGNVFEL